MMTGAPLPEHSQMKIAFYSFPSTSAEIEVYSRLGNIDVVAARHLADHGHVTNVVQIGFYLSGDVLCSSSKSRYPMVTEDAKPLKGYLVRFSL